MTHLKLILRTCLFTGLVATSVLACSSEDADPNGGAGGNSASGTSTGSGDSGSGESTGSSSSVAFECCINDVGYACPSNAALTQCIGFDIDGCMSECGFDDFDCQDACWDAWDDSTPDPSACTQNAAVTCEGGGGTTSSGGGGLCVGDWDGTYCEKDSDCSSYNCVDDQCYASTTGNPCDQDSDCDTYNCTAGCCYDKSAGNPCEQDSDCDSYNCYDGTCQ